MRMFRVALVLFVLVSFVAATAAVSMGATVTPIAKPTMNVTKPTVKPVASMMPTKKPSKMIDLTQMKANVEGIYKKLKTGAGMPVKNNTTATRTNTTKRATVTPFAKTPTAVPKPSMKLDMPGMRAMAPMAMSNVGLVTLG